MSKRKQKKDPTTQMNAWGAIRDIGIAAINKGQALEFFFALFFIIVIIKMPKADVSKLVFQLFDIVILGNFLGYVFGLCVVMISIGGFRAQRRIHTREIDRLSKERTKWQEQVMNIESGLGSSKLQERS